MSARCGCIVKSSATVCGLVLVGAGLLPTPASAADPCTQSGGTTTCTYTSTGHEQTFTVPASVKTINVTAVGGRGHDGPPAAMVSGQLTVTPGSTLYVYVGGDGSECGTNCDGLGGFNGGGPGSFGSPVGNGGGGASDVRTKSGFQNDQLKSRLIVAGGSGGGGASGPTAGGDATKTKGGKDGAAGKGGGDNSGGASGAFGAGGGGGVGGSSAKTRGGGGSGGGGGYYGGGGGGGGATTGTVGGAGGAGSSLVPDGGTVSTATSEPSVTISYTSSTQ
ncbi:hypothetical protein FOS14_02385 [Skermania sp. ID1734]|uniref:glycine-rich protein n=1 Tax=Skermania sp. ID1734 TaxID=2597516 RepID=UPI00117E0CA5|nr:glycine-rich protein [Skermania sp. ID1734]TSE01421.1 hypothetical protein FOS14_02385 [Skermania sp. ID1734]